MARQSNNHIMKGARGMFGKQVVFKVRKGKQILAAPPNVDEDRVPTPNQKAAQDRFKFSSEYANNAIKDADLKRLTRKLRVNGNQHRTWRLKMLIILRRS